MFELIASMDIDVLLADLRKELERVGVTILALEEMRAGGLAKPRGKRGRKSMGAEERMAVSARIKRYWGIRRSVAKQAVHEAPHARL